MTKRIFKSICLVAIAVFTASVILFFGVLYDYFGNVRRIELKTRTELAAQGVAAVGEKYFEGLSPKGYRISWISAEGDVLYDSEADSSEMENHLAREEIKEAIDSGYGESSRYSATLMQRTLYSAERLPDGTVVRISVAQSTLLTLLLGMFQPIIIIIVIAVGFSFLLAHRLSKKITAPLNRLDLDDPLSSEAYDELSPLLRRIDTQQRQIRRQEEKLRLKQEEFETVTENMAEGIILLNTKGVILSINRAASKLFGADSGAVGENIMSKCRCAEITELLTKVQNKARSEKIIDIGGVKYQFDVSPVTEGGAVSGAVLLMHDVTEKERAEALRREFTANVSHELKTPLHTIAGCAELLENGMVRAEDAGRFYTQIHSEAKRMISLVEDIIRLSHLDEGAKDMKREETDLYALCEDVVKALFDEAKGADVTVMLEGSHAVLSGIPQLLESVVFNLCDNAVKYNRRGGSVRILVENGEREARLSVSDTGIGIPKEHLGRVFERFYRVDKSRSKELGGTGLGLSIVKHAAKVHGASIDIDSTVGVGTNVTVTFPKSF